ncbi:MAG: hypothetical protein JW839_08155 [Candidatus Lokiarchaeota archaeon]|nr:hypothetical protein [Candidatus Lokiarchaeota archaeon]
MNDQERRDAARLLKRNHKDQHNDDHGMHIQTSWAQRVGGRMKKDSL